MKLVLEIEAFGRRVAEGVSSLFGSWLVQNLGSDSVQVPEVGQVEPEDPVELAEGLAQVEVFLRVLAWRIVLISIPASP